MHFFLKIRTAWRTLRYFPALFRGTSKRRMVLIEALGLLSSALNVLGVSSLIPFLGVAVTGQTQFLSKYIAPWAPTPVLEALHSHFFLVASLGIIMISLLKFATALAFIYVASDTLEKHTARIGLSLSEWHLRSLGILDSPTPKSEILYLNQQLPRLSSFNYALLELNFRSLNFVGLMAFMIWMSPQLTIGALAAVSGVVALIAPFFRWTRRTSDHYFNALRLLQARLNEVLDGGETIRSLGLFRKQLDSIATANSRLVGAANRISLSRQSVASLPEVVTFALAVLAFSILRPGAEQAVQIASFAYAASRLLGSVNELGSRFSSALELRKAADELYSFLENRVLTDDARFSRAASIVLKEPLKSLEVRDLTVRYGDKVVLRNLDLNVPIGRKVRIQGQNGSGKSSFVRCVAGLQRYTGSVLVNGIELQNIPEEELRGRLAYLPQNPFLFEGTIAENLLIGNPDATLKDADRLCEALGLRALFSRLPRGLNSPVSESSTNISGGERQALCIARTLLRHAEIFVLDEYANHLDHDILKSVDAYLAVGFSRDSTLLAITHSTSGKFDLQLEFSVGSRPRLQLQDSPALN